MATSGARGAYFILCTNARVLTPRSRWAVQLCIFLQGISHWEFKGSSINLHQLCWGRNLCMIKKENGKYLQLQPFNKQLMVMASVEWNKTNHAFVLLGMACGLCLGQANGQWFLSIWKSILFIGIHFPHIALYCRCYNNPVLDPVTHKMIFISLSSYRQSRGPTCVGHC